MTNVILCGCTGRMGKAFSTLARTHSDIKIVAGIDINTDSAASDFPI